MLKLKWHPFILQNKKIELAGFQTEFKQFNVICVPFFANTANDLQTKIAEFKEMIGIQQFLSLISLYSQYIPLNAIVNHHILLQAEQLKNLASSSFGKEPSVNTPYISK